jgi:hypothetical protein
MSAPSRKRQGNPQLGIEICTHICGCVFPENAVRKLRRKPIWLRHCPVFLRDGGHSRFHIQNSDFHPQCNQACVVLDGKARSLTREEYDIMHGFHILAISRIGTRIFQRNIILWSLLHHLERIMMIKVCYQPIH